MSRIETSEVGPTHGRPQPALVRGIAVDLAKVASPSGRDPNHEPTESGHARRRATLNRNHDWVERQLLSAPQLTDDRWEEIARIIHRQITCAREASNVPPFLDA